MFTKSAEIIKHFVSVAQITSVTGRTATVVTGRVISLHKSRRKIFVQQVTYTSRDLAMGNTFF